MRTLLLGTAAAVTLLAAGAAQADAIPYPDSGHINLTTYSFTAAASGDVMAYFVGGSGASFDNQVSMLINGSFSPNGFGLDNHGSSVGDSFDLGTVSAGDVLTFVMRNFSIGDGHEDVFSNPALNNVYDNIGVDPSAPYTGPDNHIYSTTYTGNPVISPLIPMGVYVAFEDEPFGTGSDFNYNDESFVFSDVSAHNGGVPEPASWALMLVGFGGLGAVLRRRRAPMAATA